VTEPRFHAGASDPDETAPITGEALDSLRASAGGAVRADRGGQHDGGSHADRSPPRASGAAQAEVPARERPDGRVPRAASAGEGSAAGRAADSAAADRGSDRQSFRAGEQGPQRSFAARYVDPAYRPDQPADRGSNGRSGYQASYGSSHQPSGQRPAGSAGSSASTDRPAATAGQAGQAGYGGGQAAGPGGGAGQGWGGYGTSSYTGGQSSRETPAADRRQYGTPSGYPSGSPLGGADPRAATAVVGQAGYSGVGAPAGAGGGTSVSGLGGALGTGPFVGGSTLGSSPTARPTARGHRVPPSRPARRARLLVRHIDPWSTLKFSLVLAVAMFFVWLVAVGVLYGVLDGMGVFDKINGLYDEVSGSTGERLITPGLVLGMATLVGAVNIVLMTALATVGAFVYNICSDLVGGVEVTLAERE
jgi:Transmembrane domain of unknown function (DUF3566)